MTAQERIIAVVGVTGAQGGEVVRALVAGGQFSVRALTRRLDSQKAKNLQDAGVSTTCLSRLQLIACCWPKVTDKS